MGVARTPAHWRPVLLIPNLSSLFGATMPPGLEQIGGAKRFKEKMGFE